MGKKFQDLLVGYKMNMNINQKLDHYTSIITKNIPW